MSSPDKILSYGTAKGAASAFMRWLKDRYKSQNVFLWSPQEAKERGYGNGWAVCWEEGPYQWTSALSGGSTIFAGETGSYSEVGPFPNGISTREWHAEPYNGFILSFYQD